jgi:hypothetical protein
MASSAAAAAASAAAPVDTNGYKKRPLGQNFRFKKNKKQKKSDKPIKQGSNDEVLLFDVQALLKR